MFVGAFDIGGTKTIVGILDQAGKIKEKKVFPTQASDCYAHLDYCLVVLQQLLNRAGINKEELSGIGVTLPGVVNSEKGILVLAAYEKWENIPVASYISENFTGIDVYCENDVNACAIGEKLFGLGQQYQHYVWMTVSTGVGGAIVCNSELVKGANGFAGELGHLKVEYEKPEQCHCGQYGCLEVQGSGTALNRIVKERAQDNADFANDLRASGASVDGAGCASLANKGNQVAQDIFHQLGNYLGKGISYCANIVNPQAIIIGGGVAASLEFLVPGMQEAIAECTFEPMKNIDIRMTELGYEAALIGAAALVLRERKGGC
ncbi:ROK family protein [Ohessyouella blattaphilus]|uniref:ROK family protein n=1 Tax=Ohessyouella blattaphilus TaxID=2949333 RepID=A0ABT1EKD6_9FIRM|nr:ROK family protein [Ohessyouella blattaphilus]MCP1111153.1 ROK family protein [Ohessyouella blattaphilus]MCR8564547.1 ROK family protein [Ohessyouella blattaphilus]